MSRLEWRLVGFLWVVPLAYPRKPSENLCLKRTSLKQLPLAIWHLTNHGDFVTTRWRRFREFVVLELCNHGGRAMGVHFWSGPVYPHPNNKFPAGCQRCHTEKHDAMSRWDEISLEGSVYHKIWSKSNMRKVEALKNLYANPPPISHLWMFSYHQAADVQLWLNVWIQTQRMSKHQCSIQVIPTAKPIQSGWFFGGLLTWPWFLGGGENGLANMKGPRPQIWQTKFQSSKPWWPWKNHPPGKPGNKLSEF